jgi:hypothetical protein
MLRVGNGIRRLARMCGVVMGGGGGPPGGSHPTYFIYGF